MKIVSVILPFYNAEKTLGLAIQSILDQTYTDFELLLYNDGSTDNSLAVVMGFLILEFDWSICQAISD